MQVSVTRFCPAHNP